MLQTLLVEFFDHLFDKLDMFQSLPDQQAMVVTHAVSFKGFHNQGKFEFSGARIPALSLPPAPH